MRYASAVLAACLSLLVCASCAQNGATGLNQPTQALEPDETLVTIDTRPGVAVRLLVTVPKGRPKGVFLQFPGGEGLLVNREGGLYGAYRRQFVALDHVAIVVDAPSDHPRGLGEDGSQDERFRVGPEHTQDVAKIVAFARRNWPGPVFLFGHSMGAISAAHLAASVNDPGIRGVVLAGSPTMRGPAGSYVSVPDAGLDRIRVPVLLVHHVDDGCRGSTFAGAAKYPPLFTASPRVGFIEVHGGRAPKSTNPCRGATYHSFSGLRRALARAIIRWLDGEDVTRVAPRAAAPVSGR